jgi:hypothetical protein
MIVSCCSRRFGQRLAFSAPFRQHAVKFSGLAEDNIQVLNVRKEGDNVDDNYSLLVDQVVNAKSAYRNSRVSTVVNKLPAKVENGKLSLKDIQFYGAETVQEAGDSISHEDFKNSLEATRNYLSSGRDLFLEDVGIGASSSLRLGTRVISDNPAHAFIFRSLLVRNLFFVLFLNIFRLTFLLVSHATLNDFMAGIWIAKMMNNTTKHGLALRMNSFDQMKLQRKVNDPLLPMSVETITPLESNSNNYPQTSQVGDLLVEFLF